MSSGLTYQLDRAISSKLDWRSTPTQERVSGVDIQFGSEVDSDCVDTWMEVFSEWLPRFDSVGWLEAFVLIKVGDGLPYGRAAGRYKEGTITLDSSPFEKTYWEDGFVLEESYEHIFVHEMIHHAHQLNTDGALRTDITVNKYSISKDVSKYAGTNSSEMVAEVGAGIARGESFSEETEYEYSRFDGPEEVYELRNG